MDKRNVSGMEDLLVKGSDGFNAIRTIVVLTVENQAAMQSSDALNKNTEHALLKAIQDGGYACVPAKGKLGNCEALYAVFNMSIEAAKTYCGRYQQTSFVITTLSDDNSAHSEYWEKTDVTAPFAKENNDYIKKDECNERLDLTEAADNFAISGNMFNYSIPFNLIDSANRLFCANIERMISAAKSQNQTHLSENDILDFAMNRVGMPAHLRRKSIIKGFYND